jgi:hypothetical protein
VEDPHAHRDQAHADLLAAIADGNAATVGIASARWAQALDDANVAGFTRPADILRWSPDESGQVLTALAAAFLAGPDLTHTIVRSVVGLSPPGRGALSRPLTLRQLVSSAWTTAVRRWAEAGADPGWWTTSSGRVIVAAMAESCCTMHPYDDVDVGAALDEVPAAQGFVPFDDVLVDLDPVDQELDLGRPLVLSFVLRAGPSPAGVSWWPPGVAEHVIGWPHPLPEVPARVEAAIGVRAIDVYDNEDFCPAPLLPIGHGRHAVPSLELLDAIARDHGTEVVSVLGTLSTAGAQLIVRTLGPAALFAPQPGIVNLVRDERAG